MTVPAVLGLEVDHCELTGHELMARPIGRSATSTMPSSTSGQSQPGSHAVTGKSAPGVHGRRRTPIRRRRLPRSSSAGLVPRRTSSRRGRRARNRRRRTAPWFGAALASARSRRASAEITHDGASRDASTRPRSGAGATDCHRGRIAQSASATRPIAPMTPRGPPSAVLSGFDASSTCGASRTRPVIATRRCQTAALSIPSNHSSTHGSVLMRTSQSKGAGSTLRPAVARCSARRAPRRAARRSRGRPPQGRGRR